MRKMTVTYDISDEQEKKLQRIVEKFKDHGMKDATINNVFESIMRYGCKYDIDDKFEQQEKEMELLEQRN